MTSGPEDEEISPLDRPEAVWRWVGADRAAVVTDGGPYFALIREALLKARHSVLIAGWDIHSDTRLLPHDPEDGAPIELGPLLTHIARRNPELKIRLLVWDYSVMYAAEREILPSFQIGWRTPANVDFRLDDRLPVGASHHQKIVVIDDRLATCGGLDLTIRRWDRTAHDPHDPDRVDPDGEPYGPYHDAVMVVSGAASRALGDHLRDRWAEVTNERLAAAPEDGDELWPPELIPDFENIEVALSRSMPPFRGRPEAREIECLLLAAIQAAKSAIYIENQYVTAAVIAEALERRLQENPALEVLIVCPRDCHGWLENSLMGEGRRRFQRYMEAAGLARRVRLVYPAVPDGDDVSPIMVHAKLMMVDDRLFILGSANLNNRSMGFDSEMTLALAADTPARRERLRRLRTRLIAHLRGVEADTLEPLADQSIFRLAGLDDAAETSGSPGRPLLPVPPAAEDPTQEQFGNWLRPLGDPERPITADQLLDGMGRQGLARRPPPRFLLIGLGIALALLLLAVAWHLVAGRIGLSAESLGAALTGLRGAPYAPLLVTGVFLLAGLVSLPVNLLIIATGFAYGPGWGFAYSTLGSLASAALLYGLGRALGRQRLDALLGRRMSSLRRFLSKNSLISVTFLRLLPVAPFSVVNLVLGGIRVRFRDYLLGTLMGLAPGLFALSFFGESLLGIMRDPSSGQISLAVGILFFWLSLSWIMQKAVRRIFDKRQS